MTKTTREARLDGSGGGAVMTPPVAAKRPVTTTLYGNSRTDDYAWLRAGNWQTVMRDASVLAPEIRAYLSAENAYAAAAMADAEPLRLALFREVRGRIKEDDSSVPAPDRPFAYGTRYGLLTVLGTSSAMVLQLAITAIGMTALLSWLSQMFEWLRWLGVAYLLFLGIRQWLAAPVDLTRTRPQMKSLQAIYGRGFLISLTNPKTLLFYGAFFPQFIAADLPPGPQIALLAGTFIAIAILVDGGWAVLSGRARGLLASRGRLRNRLTGGLLIGAGLGLALARRR